MSSFTYYPDKGHTVGRHIADGTLTDDSRVITVPAVQRGSGLNMALQLAPGATVLIETTLSPPATLDNNTAIWMPTGHGLITENLLDVGQGGCTAIRLTATGEVAYQMQI